MTNSSIRRVTPVRFSANKWLPVFSAMTLATHLRIIFPSAVPSVIRTRYVPITSEDKAVKPWSWNGDLDRVSISPSILTVWEGDDENGLRIKHVRHSVIKGGIIQFQRDCTHELAGKIRPIPSLEPEEAY